MKRKMERISVLFLATIILAVTVGTAETTWSTSLEEQSRNREADVRVRAESSPNDPYWSWQWGSKKTLTDWAWNTTVGGSDVLVAIIDSGIDYTHQDLAANYVPLGYDWVNSDPYPMDDYDHGTKVAGIIAAQINNGKGIAGLAQVKIMAEKVLNNAGEGSIDDLASGIRHATDKGAKIISMSLSAPDNDTALYTAVQYAYAKNVLLVAAAGNYRNNTKRYPAAYDEVIAVTSTNQSDQKAPSSNYGSWVELAAPGVDIFTTALPNEDLPFPYRYYRYGSGTSYACAHASGLAALVWSAFPNATRDWIRNRLRETADDLGDPGFDEYYGYGRINARKAITINGTSPAINYTLTITTTAGGTTSPSQGTYPYPQGEIVSVQAIPNTEYAFDHWELDNIKIGATNPINVTMDKNHTLYAFFVFVSLDDTDGGGGSRPPLAT